MILSILICSMEKRAPMLTGIVNALKSQCIALGVENEVEILASVDKGEKTTGTKRNELLQSAQGKYTVYIDDDDEISQEYIAEILAAASADMDCITFDGFMTTNGRNSVDFEIKLGNPYMSTNRPNGSPVYLRYPNHISVIKRELAIQVKFRDICHMEDYHWATEIMEKGLLKTGIHICKKLYHYRWITHK